MPWLTSAGTGPMVNQSLASLDEDSASYESWHDPECNYLWPTPAVTVVLCTVYSLLGATGFIGNLTVVYTIFFKKGPQSVTSMLLCSLAISDLIVVTVHLPFKLADLVTDSWILGPVPCKLAGYLNLVSPACSTCMLMVIGLERFVVILFPLRARSIITRLLAKFIVAGTWIVSFILAIPGMLLQNHALSQVTGEEICYKDYQDIELLKKGYPMYCMVIFYIIPLVVMGFAYTTVCMRLYASAKTSRGLQSMKAGGTSSGTKPIRSTATTNNNANGFSAASGHPNPVPSSVDDDPFSGASETRATAGGGSCQARQPRRQRRPVSLKDRQQVILMLILVVVLYAVTWGPLLMVMVLFAFGGLNSLCMNVVYQLSAATHVLTFLNSAINPVVYSFMSRNFRQSVAEALRATVRWCCCRGGRRRQQYAGGRGESAYQSSRYSTTTLVTQASSVRRGRSTSDGNSSPSRAQNIELTQYTRLPNVDTTA